MLKKRSELDDICRKVHLVLEPDNNFRDTIDTGSIMIATGSVFTPDDVHNNGYSFLLSLRGPKV